MTRKPFSRFFIKDYLHKYHMGNNNNKNQANNLAAPDGGAGVPNGGPNPSSVVAVDSRGQPVSLGNDKANTDGEVKTQGTPQGGTAGDNLAQNQTIVKSRGATAAPEGSSTGSGGLDIDKLIEESTTEIKTGDDIQEARKEKQELLMKAINSRMYIESIIFKNQETDEQVGTKMRYIKDPYGKTIYDYMNDEAVSAHIGFKVSESDPKDGSPIEEQISIYWINPAF